MPSFLPIIRKEIAKGFRGRLLRGTIRRRHTIFNEYHDVETVDAQLDGTSVTDYTFDGMRENFDALYKAQSGIPATDVKILVILGSVAITPTQNDIIKIGGIWHKVREVLTIDPASATASLQCFEIPDPDAD